MTKGFLTIHKATAPRNWGKYRVAIDGYVYTVDGKIVAFMGEDAYTKCHRRRPSTVDRMVEDFIKQKK